MVVEPCEYRSGFDANRNGLIDGPETGHRRVRRLESQEIEPFSWKSRPWHDTLLHWQGSSGCDRDIQASCSCGGPHPGKEG
jgi:hypothetical protein